MFEFFCVPSGVILGGFVEYGHGHIDNPCDIDALASKFEFKKGVVTTGNSLDATGE